MKLSHTMIACLRYIEEGGGTIERFSGGFWATPGKHPHYANVERTYYGTNTVDALVRRKLLEYSEWETRRSNNGMFPIEAKMVVDGSE